MRAKSSQTFVTKIGLDWINATNEYIQSTVKLLLINDQRIVNIALHKVLMMESGLGQISELFQKEDAVTATSLRRFSNESLTWILSQVVLKVPNFVRQ